jgi:hypothetical protein
VFYSESDTRRYDRDGDGGGEGMGEASRNFHNEASRLFSKNETGNNFRILQGLPVLFDFFVIFDTGTE